MNNPPDGQAGIVTQAGKKNPCPVCGKPRDYVYRPFCSGRCADLDLGKWLKGNYRVATEERPREGDFEDDCDMDNI
ncbi:MAG TPA: DNA gyrase inhibitor YacG [Alphaproteobacteria bacterium]|nr:DNA gyrase inhibitor YacG [Alphaproteobacteria bacterium]